MQLSKLAIALAAALTTTGALATNGMNMEGYGAKATALGGAGSAYDTGNSAVMNNPATLGMMREGSARLGLGIRMLGPDVEASIPAMGLKAGSDGDSYWMPSFSYMRRDGNFTYGAAVLAQGGMGTKYGNDSFLGLSGDDIKSEVGVGRLMFPLAFNVNDRLTVGGSVDVVWATMDLQMDMPGGQLGALMMGQGGSVSTNMPLPPDPSMLDWARFDFNDSSDFMGRAKGYGLGFKLGLTYALSNSTTLGASFHSETNLDDLDTSDATMSMSVGGMRQDLKGDVDVKDFQWPETWSLGLAHQATDKVLIVTDVKYIRWSDVMDDFRLVFKPHDMPGGYMDVTMKQDWDNQFVFQMGVQYQATPKLAVRLGANLASNPIPNAYLNPLFPAIVEHHFSGGIGYKFNDQHGIDFSLTYADEVEETTGTGIDISHSQLSWALNYNYLFN